MPEDEPKPVKVPQEFLDALDRVYIPRRYAAQAWHAFTDMEQRYPQWMERDPITGEVPD